MHMAISSASAGGTPPEQSASFIVAKTAAGSHTLTIDGYSRIKDGKDLRKSIRSDTFTVGGHTWCTEFILHSDRFALLAGWTFMVLRLRCTHCSDGEGVSAACKFSLLDDNGQPSYTRSVGDVCTRFSEKMSSGVAFADTKFLESRAATYLHGDCHRVRCDVTFYMEPRCEDRDVPSRLVTVPPPDIGEHLGRLLSSGVGVDLTSEVAGGETFAAHRYILNVRSPILLEETLALAEEYNCHGLKKACVQFLMSGSNLKAAMEAGGFENLRSSCPSVLKELLAMVDRR